MNCRIKHLFLSRQLIYIYIYIHDHLQIKKMLKDIQFILTLDLHIYLKKSLVKP